MDNEKNKCEIADDNGNNDCSAMFQCCDCGAEDGEDGCGCAYCWSCNACETCKDDDTE